MRQDPPHRRRSAFRRHGEFRFLAVRPLCLSAAVGGSGAAEISSRGDDESKGWCAIPARDNHDRSSSILFPGGRLHRSHRSENDGCSSVKVIAQYHPLLPKWKRRKLPAHSFSLFPTVPLSRSSPAKPSIDPLSIGRRPLTSGFSSPSSYWSPRGASSQADPCETSARASALITLPLSLTVSRLRNTEV